MSERSVKASRDLLISQQASKGFEDLGSDKLMVRLGGIYALEGVMNAPEQQYHQPALEALCAFVRDGTKDHTADEPPTTEIQAVLTVIRRRASGQQETPEIDRRPYIGTRPSGDVVDLSKAHIQKALLYHANLSGANLSGADLSGADLSGAELRYTNLSGANLNGANLSGAAP